METQRIRRELLIYLGLLITLFIYKYVPKLEILPLLYMLLSLFILRDEELDFKNYRKGFLYGVALFPLFILLPTNLFPTLNSLLVFFPS